MGEKDCFGSGAEWALQGFSARLGFFIHVQMLR